MGCNCKNKKNANTEAQQTQKIAEARRTQLREARAKEAARANAK